MRPKNYRKLKTTPEAKPSVFEQIQQKYTEKRLLPALVYISHKDMEMKFYQIKNVV